MANQAYQKLKDTNALPSSTGVALEILRLASDEKTTLNTISKVIESDPALAGRILKLVNSPFAGVARRVSSISVAVRLLGLRTIKNLALGLSLISNYRNGCCASFDYDHFWSESLARAVAARQIADQLKSIPADEMLATGLLSQVGRLALATVYPEKYTCIVDRYRAGSRELADMEYKEFGIDHNQLSAEMMTDWRLQEPFCEAVRFQDTPEKAGSEPEAMTRQLAWILHLAGAIASVLADQQTTLESLTNMEDVAAKLGISRDTLNPLFESIGNEWREAGKIFSVSTQEVATLEQLHAQILATCERKDDLEERPIRLHKEITDESNPLRVLIVDDDPAELRLIEKYLIAAGYQVRTAANGAEALEIDRLEPPQMIITDWMMPEMDGLELCHRLRANDSIGFVYVIVLTAQSEKSRAIEALQAGADDFLAKPCSREELLAHVLAGERIVRLEANLAERSREISRYNARLTAANDKLRIVATTDELTGLANRREGLARLAEHWSLATRYGMPLSCIIADIDHFKRFNDTYGHAAGDEVLRAVASLLKNTCRAGELVCRIGGEEFLIICPKASAASAQAAANRMCSAVASNTINFEGNEWLVTLSAGAAERTESMDHPDNLLKAADEMLYAAKQAGRNRVCASNLPECPPSSKPQREREAVSPVHLSTDHPNDPSGKILVVDDDSHIRALCRRILEHEGYVVSEAVDGLDALEKTLACQPDVIVLDVMMPNLDGLECARRLKTNTVTREIPIIMLSSANETESIEAGLEAGADEYITKPFRHREFILRVRSMARLYHSRAELLRSNETRWQQARSLQALLDLSVALMGAERYDSILEQIVLTAAELTQCQRVSIMLPDHDGKFLTIAQCVGFDKAVADTVRVPVGEGIAGRVYLSGKQVIVNSPESTELPNNHYESQFFASAPLISKALRATDQTVGVLNVTERWEQKPFGSYELESLDLLCSVAATALDDILSRKARDHAQDSIVLALTILAEYRDTDTAKHLDRVTRYATMLAEELQNNNLLQTQINGDFLEALRRAMPLHDIGKVGVPDHLLLNPGRLTENEMQQMSRHTEIGARIIRSVAERMPEVSFLRIAEEIAKGHHERWDGQGYPCGTSGHDTPLSARIAAVADVYDALTTKRVYKDPVPHEKAVAIIQENTGSQFDPLVVNAFLACEQQFVEIAAEMTDQPAESESPEILVAQ